MHKVMIRFKDVVSGKSIEVQLDDRLSFKDNFVILEEILDRDLKDDQVYDPHKKIFLDRNIPLSEFQFEGFIFLHLFHSAVDFKV